MGEIPSQTKVTAATPEAAPRPSLLPSMLENDPTRTGFDPETAWWMNYFRILTGRMTPEGQFHYREQRYKEHEASDCARCEKDRDWLFKWSPVVTFMREKIGDLGGELNGKNVLCRRCPARLDSEGNVHRQSGGFSPAHGILICANEVRDRGHLEDTLAHEMVHAWDHLRWKVDWTGDEDLRHAACTEVSWTSCLSMTSQCAGLTDSEHRYERPC
jgi:mitochondrial inner membrane protease ATP23